MLAIVGPQGDAPWTKRTSSPSASPSRSAISRRMAIAELEVYIVELEEEIARARADIAAKRKQRGGAEALFKR